MAELVAAGEQVYGVRVLRSTLEDAYLEVVDRVMTPRSSSRATRCASRCAGGSSPSCSASRSLFGGLYAWGAHELFEDVGGFGDDQSRARRRRTLAGATILGLAMFGALFLGAVLAVFLTPGAVRGDAERGLLQPLIVRPLGRRQLPRRAPPGRVGRERRLRARRLPGAPSCMTGVDRRLVADHIVGAGLRLAARGRRHRGAGAAGLGLPDRRPRTASRVLMVYGAGLLAGLLGAIGDAIPLALAAAHRRRRSWALPFEELYRDALRVLVGRRAA